MSFARTVIRMSKSGNRLSARTARPRKYPTAAKPGAALKLGRRRKRLF